MRDLYHQIFATSIGNKSLKLSSILNCLLKRANDLKNDFKLINFAFDLLQKFEADPYEWKSLPNPSGTQQRCNKYLTNLVFSDRTVSYVSLFFPLWFMACGLRAWGINRRGKNSVRNLRYGPWTRLLRGMYKRKKPVINTIIMWLCLTRTGN